MFNLKKPIRWSWNTQMMRCYTYIEATNAQRDTKRGTEAGETGRSIVCTRRKLDGTSRRKTNGCGGRTMRLAIKFRDDLRILTNRAFSYRRGWKGRSTFALYIRGVYRGSPARRSPTIRNIKITGRRLGKSFYENTRINRREIYERWNVYICCTFFMQHWLMYLYRFIQCWCICIIIIILLSYVCTE